MTAHPTAHWAALTSVELEAWAKRDAVALIPTAAIEQHGPHLPLSTDIDIGLGLIDSAAKELDGELPLLILPTIAPAASDEHLSYPGTLSLGAVGTERAILAAGEAVAAIGIRRVVIANSHGGNLGMLETAALELRRGLGLLVVKASWPHFPAPDTPDLPESEWRHGLHGGAIETAMMRHLAPEKVREPEVRDFLSTGEELESAHTHLGPTGPAASFAWLAEDLNPHGVTGRASLGTAALGARLVTHYGRILADILRDAHRFDLSLLADAE